MSDENSPQPVRPQRSSLILLLGGGAAVGLLMAFAVMLYGSSGGSSNRLPTPIPDAVIEGEPAPDFEAEMADGTLTRLADYRGSVVAVNFWATWCAPCKVEMPILQEAYEDGKMVVLAINADDTVEQVQTYMTELGLTFPALLDPNGELVDLYAVRVFPTTVLIDEKGIVIAEHYGPLTPEIIDQYLED